MVDADAEELSNMQASEYEIIADATSTKTRDRTQQHKRTTQEQNNIQSTYDGE